jgi:hypothetical protein
LQVEVINLEEQLGNRKCEFMNQQPSIDGAVLVSGANKCLVEQHEQEKGVLQQEIGEYQRNQAKVDTYIETIRQLKDMFMYEAVTFWPMVEMQERVIMEIRQLFKEEEEVVENSKKELVHALRKLYDAKEKVKHLKKTKRSKIPLLEC